MNSLGNSSSFNKDNYHRRDLFPRGGEKYTLADMITMLSVDSYVRELIPTFNETEMENHLMSIRDGEEFRIFGNDGETRFVCEKRKEMYEIKMALAVNFAVNNRLICSHPDLVTTQFGEQYGRVFMGLGGNSVPGRPVR